MEIGAAAGPVGHTAAGDPPVFSFRLCLVVQPDLEALDIAVLVTVGDQKAGAAGDIPASVVDIEAGNALQIVKVREDAGEKLPGNAGLGQRAVHVPPDALLIQPPGEQVGPVLGGEFQVHEHIVVGIVPGGQGAGLPFRRFL